MKPNQFSIELHDLLTLEEVAGLFKISEKTLRKWIYRGDVPYLKLGKLIRFNKRELTRWLQKTNQLMD